MIAQTEIHAQTCNSCCIGSAPFVLSQRLVLDRADAHRLWTLHEQRLQSLYAWKASSFRD